MKPIEHATRPPLLVLGLGATLAAMMGMLGISGCTGALGDGGMPATGETASTGTAATSGGTTGVGNSGGTTTGAGGSAPGAIDPGSVAIHRLNAFEYDNTINDLLGLSQNTAQKTFIPDEKGQNGFDSEADAFTMTDDEFQQYFNSSDTIGEQVFASPTLISKVITCTPASATDAACLSTVINTFGARAYRRPLTTDEVTQYQKLAADAVANGVTDFNGQVKQIVKAMLTSMPFLYRIEADANPASTAVHPLSSYELASRLSYLLWSSMPDTALFADAKSGALTSGDGTVTTELTRMLADPKAANFVSSFAGQWLGVRDLGSHQVEPTAFPAWNDTVRQAMMQEVTMYFGEFLNGDLPWNQFLTAQVNFVNGPLAAYYGIKGIPATQTTMTKVTSADPNRVGFMGLGGFLTQSSYSYRTVPTLRGRWVLENLLGETIPSPPPGIPSLDSAPATDSNTQEENVRARLLAHRANAGCAVCHNNLDPIGLGMENFDGVGKYRTAYGNSQAIDASGMLPDGTMFNGLAQLATIMSTGSRLDEVENFAIRQVMTYATSRPLDEQGTDAPYIAKISQQWGAQNYSFKGLLQDVVLSDTFRTRHGGI